MDRTLKPLALVFSAGALGALANSLAVWMFGVLGISEALGVNIAPALSAGWLYPRIVWGGIWGVLFLLPFFERPWWMRGLIFSLGPTLVQLLIVFPIKADKGMLGIDLGVLTPMLVLFFNAVWGLVAAWCLFQMNEKGKAK